MTFLRSKTDILNSQKAIVFGGNYVPYCMFCSTVNSICPVLCSSTITIAANEEAVIPALLDARNNYLKNTTLLLSPRRNDKQESLLQAHVVIDYNSPIVPMLMANVSGKPVTIAKGVTLADEEPVSIEFGDAISYTVQRAPSKSVNSPVKEALSKADPSLTSEQKSALNSLLVKYSDVLSAGPEDLGRTNLMYHKIDIGDSGPIRQGMRRIPHEQIPVLLAEVDKLQKARMVEQSSSPFASPTILVKKKDGTMRLYIDYRKLNGVTKKYAHPLPRIEDIFDTLAGSKFFTTLDLAMGYHQV